MLVKVDLQHKSGKTESLIFGHEKSGKDWKEMITLYMGHNHGPNMLRVLKVGQVNGNSPKGFLWCRPSNWSKLTGTTLPRFKDATTRTVSYVTKKCEGAQVPKKPSRTRNKDSDGQEN